MAPRVRGRARGKAPLVLAPPSRSPSLSNIESAISISDDDDNNNDKEDETSSVPQFSLVERSVITSSKTPTLSTPSTPTPSRPTSLASLRYALTGRVRKKNRPLRPIAYL
ncbi:hypothetical protein PENARI_c029G08767 [Penicillium arizonense]|uniref:Uncharacterized protein n=1 Tax=Penicillium arizonense TaxID=1835702 RepID=A0A1F5L674_PENAI|nr:hypothetical protein PENARI_c029G08767 [Penicillium arizonense]OGE48421.1 hypothetical protein PENARI_c029G08767 [Penicillium arizonense]